jgi:hypothetical protein
MKLGEYADVIRSKNAGIHYVTVDIMFHDAAKYDALTETGALSAEVFADTYDLPEDEVRFFEYDAGLALKVTIPRRTTAGSPGDSDVFGAQQHVPALDIDVPVDAETDDSSG